MWIGTPAGVKEFAAELGELKARIEVLEAAWRLALDAGSRWRAKGLKKAQS